MALSAPVSAATAQHATPNATVKMTARNVSVSYGAKQAVKEVSIDIGRENVTAFIGPSGCGKSTFLRCLNRMNDTIQGARVTGTITLDGEDITSPDMDVVQLRARVGMVFQKPNPFPKSIFENVAYGPRIHGLASGKDELDAIVEKSLRRGWTAPSSSTERTYIRPEWTWCSCAPGSGWCSRSPTPSPSRFTKT